MLASIVVMTCGLAVPTAALSQAAHAPAVEWESILDTFFHNDNGTIRLDQYVIAFAPESELKAEVVVMGEDRKVRARFPFHTDVSVRDGAFARARVQGPAEVQLKEPGLYNLIFTVNGKPATAFAFQLKDAGSGGDELNPTKAFHFDGLWRQYAHLTMRTFKDQQIPELTFWVGGLDLPAGAKKGMYRVALLRDGKEVAHSKTGVGNIAPGHFKRTKIDLWHPHEDKATANAKAFALTDWLGADGKHELRVTRKEDGETIRTFPFEVAGGNIKPLPQTELKHEPAVAYIVPRVGKKNVNVFEMTEAIWLQGK
jgi:hypothetical protein